MKIEINKDAIEKVLKNKRRKLIISKKNINKSYYILLVFMVGLASISVYTNINNNYDDSMIESDVTTVFSNNEENISNVRGSIDEEFLNNLGTNLHFLTESKNILNSEYTDGITKFEINGKKNIYSLFEGTVENIYLDYCYGYTVVISKGNNIRIKYCNLDSNIKLNIGDNIKKGDIIGTSIEHSLMESSYIYVVLYYNNETINIINLFEM